MMAHDELQPSRRDSFERQASAWPTELGTGVGDRFEDVQGRSGLSKGGVRLADEVPQ